MGVRQLGRTLLRSARRPRWIIGAGAALVALAVSLATGTATGAFTATVANTGGKIATGSQLLTVSRAGTTQCSSVASPIPSTSSFPCTGSWLPSTLPSTGASSTEVITNTGTLTPASATFAANSCGPVQLANSVVSTDPMLARGTVTYAASGPTKYAGSTAYGTDGSSGYASNVTSATSPTSFSVAEWFMVPSGATAGGDLMGFGSSPSAVNDTTADRLLWMDTKGDLDFGIIDNTAKKDVVSSSAAYNDGKWHLASVTVTYKAGTLSLFSTMTETLYVDGSSVATTTFNLGTLGVLLGAEDSYTGYWHAGWSPLSGWAPAATSSYLAGSIADPTVWSSTVLTSANETSLYAATSQSAYASAVTAISATSELWPLGDAGGTVDTANVAYLTTQLCSQIGLTVGGTGFCTYPASPTTTCSTTTYPTVAAVVTATSATAATFAPTAPGTPTSLTASLYRESTYDTNFSPGLHLLVTSTYSEKRSSWQDTFTFTSASTQVIV